MANIPADAHIIIIGAMKAGTSFLYGLLGQHPAICKCKFKEPEYFSEIQIHGLRKKEKQHLRYEDLWDFDSRVHKYALEASTGYSKYPREPNVAKNIFDYGIKPTFIYVVRNPFDRVESQYNFAHATGLVDASLPITDDRYVNFSRYYLQLSQYASFFPKENIIVIDFDELITHPQHTVDLLCKQLHIEKQVLDFDKIDKNETGLKPHRLNQQQRNDIYEKIRDDMHKFKQEYYFPVEQWGFGGLN